MKDVNRNALYIISAKHLFGFFRDHEIITKKIFYTNSYEPPHEARRAQALPQQGQCERCICIFRHFLLQ